MIYVKESLLTAFYRAIEKMGAKVDEKDGEISFEISSGDPTETEFWSIEKVKGDAVRIKWDHTQTDSSNPAMTYRTAPTQRCKDKIMEALVEAGKPAKPKNCLSETCNSLLVGDVLNIGSAQSPEWSCECQVPGCGSQFIWDAQEEKWHISSDAKFIE